MVNRHPGRKSRLELTLAQKDLAVRPFSGCTALMITPTKQVLLNDLHLRMQFMVHQLRNVSLLRAPYNSDRGFDPCHASFLRGNFYILIQTFFLSRCATARKVVPTKKTYTTNTWKSGCSGYRRDSLIGKGRNRPDEWGPLYRLVSKPRSVYRISVTRVPPLFLDLSCTPVQCGADCNFSEILFARWKSQCT